MWKLSSKSAYRPRFDKFHIVLNIFLVNRGLSPTGTSEIWILSEFFWKFLLFLRLFSNFSKNFLRRPGAAASFPLRERRPCLPSTSIGKFSDYLTSYEMNIVQKHLYTFKPNFENFSKIAVLLRMEMPSPRKRTPNFYGVTAPYNSPRLLKINLLWRLFSRNICFVFYRIFSLTKFFFQNLTKKASHYIICHGMNKIVDTCLREIFVSRTRA